MTTAITKPLTWFIAFIFFLAACTKPTTEIPAPVQQPGEPPTVPAQKGSFQFSANVDLSGQPYHSSNLHAVITVKNEAGAEVVKEQMIGLTLPTPVNTGVLELPVGKYKLSSFRLVYGSVNTHFASPIAGSTKAAQVQKPLALDFTIEAGKSITIPVEVLRVAEGEKPQVFGYPSGAFDNGQADASPFIKVKMKAIMKIGNIVYDSLPASLRITTWSETGEMTTTYGTLAAGVNTINVLKAASKYEFLVSKWGTTDAITLNRQDVDENTIYILGGSKEAKKLKSERVYKMIEGKDVADTKTDYHYDHEGKLLKIDYWMRKQDNTPYFAMADWFEYSGAKVSKIRRTNIETNSTMKETRFTYDQQGKVSGMQEEENGWITSGVATYLPSLAQIGIAYNLPSGHTLNYNLEVYRGNVIHSTAANSNGSFEEGRYSYDFGINPYAHMNWPTLFLANQSINNVTSQQKQYSGAFPTTDPYSMVYKYDGDGYPVEVVKNYRSPQSGSYLFSTKTIFVY
ncbi:MAG: hypothetical protein ACO1OO_03465 [Flavisolibacter sp.]